MSARFKPLPESIGHTPIYKIHRYFARRPHNQFRALIEQASGEGDVVLDCMAGGGVTLIEGLTLNRRVISADINPIAALVQRTQAAEWDPDQVEDLLVSLVGELPGQVRNWYSTECDHCGATARIRWFECAYRVHCPGCSEEVMLSNENRAKGKTGQPTPGRYMCCECNHEFRAIEAPRRGHEYIAARVKCGTCDHQWTRPATTTDTSLAQQIADAEEEMIEFYGLEIPRDEIPAWWDRQHEDALSRKGFTRFADLFTPRNRIILALLLRNLKLRADRVQLDEFIAAVTVVSSLVRYVNNMTVATPGWMDGRPVAWAKHAYWTPNQFVECNPYEYLENRIKAMRSAASDRRQRFSGKRYSETPTAVIKGAADYSVLRADARNLPLPSASVDAIITDPPFGSNVQYGELTTLWTAWLGDLNPFHDSTFMEREVLVTRRTKIRPKTFKAYQLGLTEIFSECFRVLKPSGFLVFTFNNKNPDAWHAVMRAAFDAGFSLDPGNLTYQHEIHAYRDTAHLRFGNELKGDVVYGFQKGGAHCLPKPPSLEAWRKGALARLAKSGESTGLQECRIAVHIESLAMAASALQRGHDDDARKQMEASQEIVSKAGGM